SRRSSSRRGRDWPNWISVTGSRTSHGNVGLAHDVAPMLHVLPDDIGQLLRGAGAALGVALRQVLLVLRAVHRLDDGVAQLAGDLVAGAPGRDHREPDDAVE